MSSPAQKQFWIKVACRVRVTYLKEYNNHFFSIFLKNVCSIFFFQVWTPKSTFKDVKCFIETSWKSVCKKEDVL